MAPRVADSDGGGIGERHGGRSRHDWLCWLNGAPSWAVARGAGHVGRLPTAGVLRGLIVVAADLIRRPLFAPLELPCGLITAVVGAPFFIYLLWRQRSHA